MTYDVLYSLLVLTEKLGVFNKQLLRVYYIRKKQHHMTTTDIFEFENLCREMSVCHKTPPITVRVF